MSGLRRTPASRRASAASTRRDLLVNARRTGLTPQTPATMNVLQTPVIMNVPQTPATMYVPNPPSPSTANVNPSGPVMKPKDVPRLDLSQLSGLEAAGRLQIFFEAVERCSLDDSTRVMIAKNRLSSELAMLIHNNQTKHKCNTWLSFCHFLRTEFAVDVNVDRAWQELEDHEYDWMFAPQSYTNKFICRHAVLETRFPGEKFPDRDKCIKRKLWQGMPKENQKRLEAFLEEDYPLNKFIDRVEHERQILMANPTSHVYHLQKEKTKSSPPNNNIESQEVKDLKEQVKTLTEALAKINNTNSPPPLMSMPLSAPTNARNPFNPPRRGIVCPCCYNTNHRLFECPHKPPVRNACFDCHRVGCRRGYPTCPGKPIGSQN